MIKKLISGIVFVSAVLGIIAYSQQLFFNNDVIEKSVKEDLINRIDAVLQKMESNNTPPLFKTTNATNVKFSDFTFKGPGSFLEGENIENFTFERIGVERTSQYGDLPMALEILKGELNKDKVDKPKLSKFIDSFLNGIANYTSHAIVKEIQKIIMDTKESIN